jgi:hypothetical protein
MSRLLDMYVNNMNKFAHQMSLEATFGCPSYVGTCRSYGLFSSKSRSPLNDELAELIRAAAEKNRRTRSGVARNVHSRSAVITRIDEDKPCDFKDSDLNLRLGLNSVRSRSCAPAQLGPFGLRWRYASSVK